ncbi:Uu.00g096480.m01.CDS01 [Anthostomella pinea]|uniref:Uu.00g096480.m01.CDS01 n=1 Tax=Anthostomella pinea TaxID=933095 RepID=A0AAI8VC42_9PEZI|nr:Uu.00g096480.m01.CDS01 [Anthostomella pinea]
MADQEDQAAKAAHAKAAMQAMMDDLGLERIEELAKDDGRGPRRRHNDFERRPFHPPPQTVHKKGGPIEPAALMYQNAVKMGIFNDDDAKGVEGLDTLNDGQSHRRKNEPIPYAISSRHNPSQQAAPNGKTHHLVNTIDNLLHKNPKYDPLHPSYRRDNNTSKRPTQPLPQGSRIGSLGGLLPPGGEIKRWEPHAKQPNGNVANAEMPGAGRGRGAPAQRPLHQALPVHLEAGRGCGAPRARGPDISVVMPARAVSSVQQTLAPPAQTTQRAASSTVGTSSFLPPHLRPKATTASEQPRAPAPVLRNQPIVQNVDIGQATQQKILPPHLRPPPSKKDNASASSTTPGSRLTQKISPLPASQTFLGMEVIILQQVGADNAKVPGRVAIYELAEKPFCLWELVVDEKKVTRADIRELLAPFVSGSTVYVRRQNKAEPKGQVRSSQLRFENIPTALYFEQELKLRQKQYSQSAEPILSETSEAATQLEGTNVADVAKPPAPAVASPVPRQEDVPSKTGTLIDFSAEQPERPSSRSDELVGLNYSVEKATTADPSIDAAIGQRDHEEEPEEQVEELEEGEILDSVSEGVEPEARPLSQDEDTKATKAALLDLKATEEVPLGENLSQASLRILSHITDAEYNDMWQTSANLFNMLGSVDTLSVDMPLEKFVALQTACLCLMRDDEFMNLSRDDHKEQRKILAVVYTNVLHATSRITRSAGDILDLRDTARSCPAEVHEVNKLTKDWFQKHPRPKSSSIPAAPYNSDIFAKNAAETEKFLYANGQRAEPKPPSQQTAPAYELSAALKDGIPKPGSSPAQASTHSADVGNQKQPARGLPAANLNYVKRSQQVSKTLPLPLADKTNSLTKPTETGESSRTGNRQLAPEEEKPTRRGLTPAALNLPPHLRGVSSGRTVSEKAQTPNKDMGLSAPIASRQSPSPDLPAAYVTSNSPAIEQAGSMVPRSVPQQPGKSSANEWTTVKSKKGLSSSRWADSALGSSTFSSSGANRNIESGGGPNFFGNSFGLDGAQDEPSQTASWEATHNRSDTVDTNHSSQSEMSLLAKTLGSFHVNGRRGS